MSELSSFLTALTVLVCLVTQGHAGEAKGVVSVDQWSFEKIIPKYANVLVKFDSKYPYGEKEDEFVKLTDVTKEDSDPEFLIATVGIADYGEKENQELGKKYGVEDTANYPVYKLFKNGDTVDPISFNGWKADDLKVFLRDHTGAYFGLSGCIKAFDEFASTFTSASDEKQNDILKQAEDQSKDLKTQKHKNAAKFYIKYMQKIQEKGAEFVQTEINRLTKLKEGKLSDAKKQDIETRYNILQSFKLKKRDEL